MGKKEKIEIPGFTIGSQYACTKCITFSRISKSDELELGDHICFERDLEFYHGILSNINIHSRDRVQVEIIHASLKSQVTLVRKLFHAQFELHDKVSIDVLPEINLRESNTYVVRYGRKPYKKEKVLKRALTQVQRNRDQDVPLGSLSSQRIRTEAQYTPNITETPFCHFAFWCATGESFSFDLKNQKISIEYTKKRNEIEMTAVYDGDESVNHLTEIHKRHVLCDKCFLTDLVRLINESDDPCRLYTLAVDDTEWIYEHKIPCGWYRVKYKPMGTNVIIKIKRYSSKYRRLALVLKTETFSFTLSPGQNCWTECEVRYRFPYGILGDRVTDEENF